MSPLKYITPQFFLAQSSFKFERSFQFTQCELLNRCMTKLNDEVHYMLKSPESPLKYYFIHQAKSYFMRNTECKSIDSFSYKERSCFIWARCPRQKKTKLYSYFFTIAVNIYFLGKVCISAVDALDAENESTWKEDHQESIEH